MKIAHHIRDVLGQLNLCGHFAADITPYRPNGWSGNSLFLKCNHCGLVIEVWCPGGDVDVTNTDWTQQGAK